MHGTPKSRADSAHINSSKQGRVARELLQGRGPIDFLHQNTLESADALSRKALSVSTQVQAGEGHLLQCSQALIGDLAAASQAQAGERHASEPVQEVIAHTPLAGVLCAQVQGSQGAVPQGLHSGSRDGPPAAVKERITRRSLCLCWGG